MRRKFKLVKILFNTGMEKVINNATLTPDTRGYHIKTEDDQYLFIPLYNILYISMEGEEKDTK